LVDFANASVNAASTSTATTIALIGIRDFKSVPQRPTNSRNS
jgi:hypothetical protein